MSSTAEAPGGKSLQVFELLRGIARWGSPAADEAPGPAPASPLGHVADKSAPAVSGSGPVLSPAPDVADQGPAHPPVARPRATVLPHRRRFAGAALADAPAFDFEQARLDILQALALQRVGDQAVYDVRDILQFAILDDSDKTRMFVGELVRRLASDTEKSYDMVVSLGDYGAVFGARLADALSVQYGGKEVSQRFLEAFTLEAESDDPEPRQEYRLKRSRADTSHLLSGKRIVFAVPTITPENWPEVFRQAQFLRGPLTNSDTVRIVAIASIGQLKTDAPHGLKIDAVVDIR